MKKRQLQFFILLAIMSSIGCKKEKSPQVRVAVVDDQNNSIENALVKTSIKGASDGIINARVLQEGRTDRFGNITFEFESTVLIDIGLFDNLGNIVDSTSVLAEVKRKQGRSENIYQKKLVFR